MLEDSDFDAMFGSCSTPQRVVSPESLKGEIPSEGMFSTSSLFFNSPIAMQEMPPKGEACNDQGQCSSLSTGLVPTSQPGRASFVKAMEKIMEMSEQDLAEEDVGKACATELDESDFEEVEALDRSEEGSSDDDGDQPSTTFKKAHGNQSSSLTVYTPAQDRGGVGVSSSDKFAQNASTASQKKLMKGDSMTAHATTDGSKVHEEFNIVSNIQRRNSSSRLRGSVEEQRQIHRERVQLGFCAFECKCGIASKQGSTCCLDVFSRKELVEVHTSTYGRKNEDAPSPKVVLQRIHQQLYPLRVLATTRCPTDAKDMKHFYIPKWVLLGREVCREAFFCAVGGSNAAIRKAVAMTRMGMPPEEVQHHATAAKAAAKLLTAEKTKTSWATSWWLQHLKFQDWLPNEHAIQYRGLKWKEVYQQLYAPNAQQTGNLLQYRQWKRALTSALYQLQAQYYPTWQESGHSLKLVRSAKHSKFPECNDCSSLRAQYIAVAKKLSSDPNIIQEAYQKLVDHSKAWQADREFALNLRYCATPRSDTVYQCDDKCGSYWQRLPISDGGRDTKENAKAVYHFSIQANVITGNDGLIRFACVPKNVSTGSNFGFTNLLMTLKLAQEQGKLGSHKTHLIRHTDGGPDNVAVTTHIFHWLLVYVGVFQKITWFRFKAGHSHTEIADRLFSIMKRLFESDNQARVGGIQHIPELVAKLTKEFRNEKEALAFEFDFANWDLNSWVMDQKLSGEHSGISSKLVYTYSYDPMLKVHGCVKVQYKNNISWQGNSTEAEYSPIVRVQEEVPTKDGEGLQTVEKNVSDKTGVRFVLHPPDLTKEPNREQLKTNEFDPAAAIRLLLSKRSKDLSHAAVEHWEALGKLHDQHGRNAEDVPEMPFHVDTPTGSGLKFSGSPQLFLTTLKSLARFPRILKCAQDFANAPPESWALAAAQEDEAQGGSACDGGKGPEEEDEGQLRDPRVENSVAHEGYRSAVQKKAREQAETENFAKQTSARVEDVVLHELYLVELDEPEGGVRLGLGHTRGSTVEAGKKKWEVEWFVLVSKEHWRAKNPAFAQYKVNNKRSVDWLDEECFCLQVQDLDLTQGSRPEKLVAPKLTNLFVKRVLQFAAEHNLGSPTEPVNKRKHNTSKKKKSCSAEDEEDSSDEDSSNDESEAHDDESEAEAGVEGEGSKDAEVHDGGGEIMDEDRGAALPVHHPAGDSSDEEDVHTAHQERPNTVEVLLGDQCDIKDKDPILMIDKVWLDLILAGKKTLEIRGIENKKNIGKQLWLCANGSFQVSGRVLFVKSIKLFGQDVWKASYPKHLVKANTPPYRTTYGWEFSEVKRVQPPIAIGRVCGAQIIQYGPHGNQPSKKQKK